MNRMAIDPNSPLGYALTILITGILIWWTILRENKFTKSPNKQEYKTNWVYDGVIQRYWKWKEVKIVTEEHGRYEFYGRGKDRYEAIRIATKNPPNKYVDVDALEFIRNPKKFSVDGVWVSYDIDS